MNDEQSKKFINDLLNAFSAAIPKQEEEVEVWSPDPEPDWAPDEEEVEEDWAGFFNSMIER